MRNPFTNHPKTWQVKSIQAPFVCDAAAPQDTTGGHSPAHQTIIILLIVRREGPKWHLGPTR